MSLLSIGKLLLGTALLLAVLGGVFIVIASFAPQDGTPFRLPGDIAIRRGNFSFYFPLGTCILISVILTLVIRFLSGSK